MVIADDHRRVRAGLRLVLEAEPDFEVVAEADDGMLALDLARRHKPDILLLDHEMPGMRGLDVARAVQQEAPGVRIVMFTFDEAIRSIAVASGVNEFLTKDVSQTRLAAALRSVGHGIAPAPALTAGRPVQPSPPSPIEEAEPAPIPARLSLRSFLPFVTYATYAGLGYVIIQTILRGTSAIRIDELAVSVVMAELLAAYSFWSSRRVERALAETRRKTRQLEELMRAAALYSGPLDLSGIVKRFLGQMRTVMGADASATLIVYDAAIRTFEPIAEVGPLAGAFKRNVYPLVVLPHEIFERVVIQQRTWLVADTMPPTETWKVLTNFFPRVRARTFCAMPLRSRGASLGAVIVYDPRPKAIDAEQLAVLETLCHFIAGALHTATLQFTSPEARRADH